jgi:hypothetical protein
MKLDALELACRVADYLNDPAPEPEGRRILSLAAAVIAAHVVNECPFACDCHPPRCTDDRPCCGDRLTYNRNLDGSYKFVCPVACVCHD